MSAAIGSEAASRQNSFDWFDFTVTDELEQREAFIGLDSTGLISPINIGPAGAGVSLICVIGTFLYNRDY